MATFDNEPKQYNDFWKSFGTPAQFLQVPFSLLLQNQDQIFSPGNDDTALNSQNFDFGSLNIHGIFQLFVKF